MAVLNTKMLKYNCGYKRFYLLRLLFPKLSLILVEKNAKKNTSSFSLLGFVSFLLLLPLLFILAFLFLFAFPFLFVLFLFFLLLLLPRLLFFLLPLFTFSSSTAYSDSTSAATKVFAISIVVVIFSASIIAIVSSASKDTSKSIGYINLLIFSKRPYCFHNLPGFQYLLQYQAHLLPKCPSIQIHLNLRLLMQ